MWMDHPKNLRSSTRRLEMKDGGHEKKVPFIRPTKAAGMGSRLRDGRDSDDAERVWGI